MSLKYGIRSCLLAAALTASTTYAAGLDAPQDSFRDWYVVDNTHKNCANVNSKAVRDYNQSSHDKFLDWMVKTEPSSPDMQVGAWNAQGKQVHTIVVVNPFGRDSGLLSTLGTLLFEIVYYKEGADSVTRRVFFPSESTCKYVAVHNALPTDISDVVMTIDGDNANAMRMSRQDFDRNVMDKAH
jgi:hypothetical protein